MRGYYSWMIVFCAGGLRPILPTGDVRGCSKQFFGQLIDDLFDGVGLVAVGDEEGVVGLDDDHVFGSEEGDVFVVSGVEDDVAVAVEGGDGLVRAVFIGVVFQILGDGDPRADVVPVEGGFDVINLVRFLHEGVVDGNRSELGEALGDSVHDVLGLLEFPDEVGEFWGVLGEFGHGGFDRPDEHAGIPGEASLVEEFLCLFRVGFFAEANDLVWGVGDGCGASISRTAALDVAEGRASPGGFDADGEEGVGGIGDGEGIAHDLLVGCGVLDELIGGEDHHRCLGIACGDESDAECDGGGGVAFGGFGKDVFGRKFGGDFADFFDLQLVCEDEDVFRRDKAVETRDGLVQQGA